MAYKLKQFEDLTHLPKDAMVQFRNDALLKTDASAYLFLKEESDNFSDLAHTTPQGDRIGWTYDTWGSKALLSRKLKDFSLPVSMVMGALETYCPVDTGFGITNGIRYYPTKNGAKIVIGKGIAEYLVHQSYPRSDSIRQAQNVHELWIDTAVSAARADLKMLGFRVTKDHLKFGEMTLYITRISRGRSGIFGIRNI